MRQGLSTSSCSTTAAVNMEVIAVASPLLQTRGASSRPFSSPSIMGKVASQTLLLSDCENPSSTIAATAAADAI